MAISTSTIHTEVANHGFITVDGTNNLRVLANIVQQCNETREVVAPF